jgi:hypothetical protein
METDQMASPSTDTTAPDPAAMESALRQIASFRAAPQGLLQGRDGFEPVREIAQRGLNGR